MAMPSRLWQPPASAGYTIHASSPDFLKAFSTDVIEGPLETSPALPPAGKHTAPIGSGSFSRKKNILQSVNPVNTAMAPLIMSAEHEHRSYGHAARILAING